MNRDASPEHDPALAAVVDALFERVALLDHAIQRADSSDASVAELRQLLGLVSAAEEAIDDVLVAVDAATAAS